MEIEVHSIEGKDIVVAKVQPADRLIAARGGYYRRVATDTRPLKAKEIVAHAKKNIDNDSAIKELSDIIATQTGTIDELRKDFNRANSLKRKLFIAVLGAIVGVVGKYLINLIG
ncbi:MAG: hypothetical protein JRC68_10310 [Deltaproteobacteria bacterium]|nr:hypothetical protein [Deltaproteobacteria bacterium]